MLRLLLANPHLVLLRWLLPAYRRSRQAVLLHTLAMAVARQVPLAEEVRLIADTAPWEERPALRRLARDLEQGMPLADALAAHPELIPPAAILTAQVGAITGNLSDALKQAALSLSRASNDLESPSNCAAVKTHLWMLVVTGWAVVTFVLYNILPKFKMIFDGFQIELPPITLQFVEMGDFVVNHAPQFSLGMLAFGVIYIAPLRRGWETYSPPLLAWLLVPHDTPGVLRHLARSVAVQSPMERVLDVLRQYHPRRATRKRLDRVYHTCLQGDDCWQALARQQLVRRSDLALIQAGQRAGNLEWVLRAIAEARETRSRFRLMLALEVLHPVALLIIAGGVMFFCIAFFQPLVTAIEALVPRE